MKQVFSLLLILAPALAAGPQKVVVPCGELRLKAQLWKPDREGSFPAVLFSHGSGTDASHTAGMKMTDAAAKLAPLFLQHGYAYLYLFRRGQGLSADQGPFMQDLLQREMRLNGVDARNRLHLRLLTVDHLDDTLAALAFLKAAPGVDPKRIAIVGHSFGGLLALLATERDPTVRAAVTFGAGAAAWSESSQLRDRMRDAVRKANAPILLIHAANDFSTAPGIDLAAELEKAGKPHVLKLYPRVGQSPTDGHNAVYGAIPLWEGDVFQFLARYTR